MEDTLIQTLEQQASRQVRLNRLLEWCEEDLETIQSLAKMVNGMKDELSGLDFDRADGENLTLILFERNQFDHHILRAMSALAHRVQTSLDRLVKIAKESEQEKEV